MKRLAVPTRPLGPTTELAYMPSGDPSAPYTVGDALQEYFDWKRLATTEATYLTLLSSVNLNVVPQLAHLPAESVNGEHVRAYVRHMLETPPKHGARTPGQKRAISSLTDEEARKRKKTINAHISVVRGALMMAWENSRIDSERPYRCWRHVPNGHRPRILHLSRTECRALLEVC